MGQSVSQSTQVEKTPLSDKDPQFVRLSRNIRRSKLAIQFIYFFEFFFFLVIAILSIFEITISQTFSQQWLWNIGHFQLPLYAFFVSRELTMDLGVVIPFIIMSIIYFFLDTASLTWRYDEIDACRADPTPSSDCSNHIWVADVILSLNWLLIFVTIIYIVCGFVIAIYLRPVQSAFARLLEIAKIRLYSAVDQQIIVQPATVKAPDVKINVSEKVKELTKITKSKAEMPSEMDYDDYLSTKASAPAMTSLLDLPQTAATAIATTTNTSSSSNPTQQYDENEKKFFFQR